jgi:hypothetical protein
MAIMAVDFSVEHLDAFSSLKRDVAVCLYAGDTVTELIREKYAQTQFISASERFLIKPCAFRSDLDPDLANEIRRHMYDVYVRCHVREVFRQHRFRGSWLDYNNHFENALHFYYGLIKDRGVKTIIFEIPPHEGTHIVLYALGHALGLRVVMCHQSIFRGGFHICERIPELGVSPVANGHGLEMKVNKKPEAPFYTKTLRGRLGVFGFLGKAGVALAKLGGRTLVLQPLWNNRGYRKALLKFGELVSFYRARNLPESLYDKFDPSVPYVYVSLHMQPEMATDLLGGRYADQLLILEHLSRELPDDFVIYAKEHPQQKMHMRDQSYFERLKMIPRVRYLRVEQSPFEVIKGARAVAAVSGTAGWEALQMGKPVLCFGAAWYRGFPGVFEWRNGPSEAVSAALAFKADLDALQTAADTRAKTLWRGLVNTVFAQLLDCFDPEENVRTVAKSIDEYLKATQDMPRLNGAQALEAAFLD